MITEHEAEQIYESYLVKFIYPLVGNVTTDIDQLNAAGRLLFRHKFKGVYPSDKIPRLTDLVPFCILNLDKTGQPGSHWVALAKIPEVDACMIYDSFGRSYKKIIPDIEMSGNGRIVNTDSDVEQAFVETSCGARSLGFLLLYDVYGPDVAKLI